MNALVIDSFEFCRLKEHQNGELTIAALPRLAKEAVDDTGSIAWSLQGNKDNPGQFQLTLKIDGLIKLTCQRCLTPLDFNISSQSILILARDEDEADQLNESLDNDEIDVIVGSKAMQVADLVEDEALLAIPLSARHDVCPDEQITALLNAIEKPSAFAALKDLKL